MGASPAESGSVTPWSRRLAGAPISWGVCEVPDWGRILAPDRVLAEMASLGLRATELGPVGYLGADPADVRRLLSAHGLRAVGGFVPLVLHDPAEWDRSRGEAGRSARMLEEVGAEVFVTAAVADERFGRPLALDSSGWDHLLAGLAELDELCAAHGLRQVLHPHVGTQVETAQDVERVLAASEVSWCFDTGHLAVAGVDVVEFAERHAARVGHVHLKDVRRAIAGPVRAGERTLAQATKDGLFCALGQGDVPVATVVERLEVAGYDGWYVLEQDVAIDRGADLESVHPADAVAVSLAYLEARGLVLGPGVARGSIEPEHRRSVQTTRGPAAEDRPGSR
jgi:inosose dehydratase